MSLSPVLYPTSIDVISADPDVANISSPLAKVYISYTGASTGHVEVYDASLAKIVDADIVAIQEGEHPGLVADRHIVALDDGSTLYIQTLGGCGCGSKLKSFEPRLPATSGRRS